MNTDPYLGRQIYNRASSAKIAGKYSLTGF